MKKLTKPLSVNQEDHKASSFRSQRTYADRINCWLIHILTSDDLGEELGGREGILGRDILPFESHQSVRRNRRWRKFLGFCVHREEIRYRGGSRGEGK